MTTQTTVPQHARQIAARGYGAISAFWAWVTEPHASIVSADARRRARLSAGMCLLVAVIFLSSLFAITRTPFAIGAALTLVASYFVARGPWAQAGVVVLIVGNLMISLERILLVTNWQSEALTTYQVFWYAPLAVVAVVLRPKWVVALIVAHVPLVVWLLSTIGPQLGRRDFGASIGSFTIIGSLFILGAYIQEYYFVRPQLDELHQAQKALQARNQALEDANREVRDFSYIVAHDLRAPLVTISEFAKEIRYELDTLRPALHQLDQAAAPADGAAASADSAEQAAIRAAWQTNLPQALGFIDSSSKQLNEMIEALLSLARSGQRNFQFEQMRLADVVRDALAAHQLRISEQSVTVDTTIAPTALVRADRVALLQVLGNLIDNALKYSRNDAPNQLHIRAVRDDEKTTISVQDHGRGIRTEDYGKVFQPFRRAGNIGDVEGIGLGLSYVQTLVQRHGGRIWFDSVVGQGTTFHISLPHTDLTQTAAAVKAP
jgi:signal transduction histidine kinase